MRRRLSLTMVVMVVSALVFAGLATLGLTVLNSVHQTQAVLVVDAKQLSKGFDAEIANNRHHDSLSVLRTVFSVLNTPLKLQGAVSYTHLDVYKRQAPNRSQLTTPQTRAAGRPMGNPRPQRRAAPAPLRRSPHHAPPQAR